MKLKQRSPFETGSMPYTENMDKVSFLQNAMVHDAVIRNIEIIGEAASNIEKHDPEFAEQYPDVLWKDADLMRNRVSHGYFSFDLEVFCKTVQHEKVEQHTRLR